MSIQTRGFTLHPWQQEAVLAWVRGDGIQDHRGTIEVVTGGGKTLIALSCAAEASLTEPDLKLAIVVPTIALARQWCDVLLDRTNLQAIDIAVLGAGLRDDLAGARALVAVLNTASKELPSLAALHQPLMLIVDEAHRAGSPKFSAVLDTPARFRLGLSATPEREEVDEDGEPIDFDEQVVGRKLGRVVYQFGLKQARLAGWLPEFSLQHHAVGLLADERARYEAISRQVDEAEDELRILGGEPGRARQLSTRRSDLGTAAKRWVALTANRKDLLYRASERNRVAAALVQQAFADRPATPPRVILFHERVVEATALRDLLAVSLPGVRVVLEHSGLHPRDRQDALAQFTSGAAPVLVSVKSLIEGIDVPAADTGISVASTASVRQRVQSLGRILRRAVDEGGAAKRSTMHLLYVGESVDELIYGKTDWSDLTGDSSNRYWRWPVGADAPEPLAGPPMSPKPTEGEVWTELQSRGFPLPWPGEFSGQEYSVDTKGVVRNAFGRLIANPQHVADLVREIRGRSGGRFRVTPQHRLVLVWGESETGNQAWLVGQLMEPFETVEEVTSQSKGGPPMPSILPEVLTPGARYDGPSDRQHGTFKISQRGGGQIERPIRGGGREYADAEGDSRHAANARAVLDAWNATGRETSRFYVNSQGHAWYEAVGERRFLAAVAGGFAWPDEEESE